MQKHTHITTAAPATVSQLTSLSVLGIDGRRYRDMIAARRIRHTRQGKLVLARVEDVLAALDLADEPVPPTEPDVEPAAKENRVLALLGRTSAR